MNKTQDFISALHGKPDLYGPFWIAITLCFSTAICGNLANFLQNQGNPKYQYTPEFERVTSAASAIFGYAFIFPFLISVKGFLDFRIIIFLKFYKIFLTIFCKIFFGKNIYNPVFQWCYIIQRL